MASNNFEDLQETAFTAAMLLEDEPEKPPIDLDGFRKHLDQLRIEGLPTKRERRAKLELNLEDLERIEKNPTAYYKEQDKLCEESSTYCIDLYKYSKEKDRALTDTHQELRRLHAIRHDLYLSSIEYINELIIKEKIFNKGFIFSRNIKDSRRRINHIRYHCAKVRESLQYEYDKENIHIKIRVLDVISEIMDKASARLRDFDVVYDKSGNLVFPVKPIKKHCSIKKYPKFTGALKDLYR